MSPHNSSKAGGVIRRPDAALPHKEETTMTEDTRTPSSRQAGLTLVELAERRIGLGGSDAAAVLGISPWATAHDVWLDKMGEGPPVVEETERMYWGTVLEDAVRRAYNERTGRKARKVHRLIRHPERPWQIGRPDGLDKELVLEVKLAAWPDGWGEPGTDEVPAHYKAQVGHYMDLTGRRRADLIVLIGGRLEALIYTVEWGRWVELMREELAEWWQTHIVEGRQPDVDGTEGSGRMVKASRMRAELEPPMIALPHQYGLLRELLKTRRRREWYETQEELLKQQVQMLMGGAEELQAPGLKISYKVRAGYAKVAYKEYAAGLEGLVGQLALGTFPVNMDPLETVAALRSLHTSSVDPTPVFRVDADADTPLLIETTEETTK
jgi:putative phage-type endonuclease